MASQPQLTHPKLGHKLARRGMAGQPQPTGPKPGHKLARRGWLASHPLTHPKFGHKSRNADGQLASQPTTNGLPKTWTVLHNHTAVHPPTQAPAARNKICLATQPTAHRGHVSQTSWTDRFEPDCMQLSPIPIQISTDLSGRNETCTGDAKTPQTGPKHGRPDRQRANQPKPPSPMHIYCSFKHTHSTPLSHSCLS